MWKVSHFNNVTYFLILQAMYCMLLSLVPGACNDSAKNSQLLKIHMISDLRKAESFETVPMCGGANF